MAEPRARQRNKGQVFGDQDLRELLYSFGDPVPQPSHSLPTTVSCLDEILTDFIIETCHVAARTASYSRRQKIKIDDFRFVLRKNGGMLGRVNEQLFRTSWLKKQRQAFDPDQVGREGIGKEGLEAVAEVGGVEEGDKKKKGRGRGRRKRKAEGDAEGAEERDAKRVAT